MSQYRIKNWPFGTGSVATVLWVLSPFIGRNGARICRVLFMDTSSSIITPVYVSWGMIREFWIGRRFVDGQPIVPIEEKETTDLFSIDVKNITDQSLQKANDYIALPNEWQMRGEQCDRVIINGKIFVFPCVEIVRACLMYNSELANQLLTQGGLDDIIDMQTWQVDGRKRVTFDFASNVRSVNKGFAGIVALINGVPALKNCWDSIRVAYIARKKIITKIPQIDGMRIKCCAIEKEDYTFVTKINSIQIPFPFSEIIFGPERTINAEEKEKTGKSIPCNETPDCVDIGPADACAKQGEMVQADGTGSAWSFVNALVVHRKTSQEAEKQSAKKISTPAVNALYTPNDQMSKGELPAANIAPTDNDQNDAPKIDIDAFPQEYQGFLCAIKQLMQLLPATDFMIDDSFLSNGDEKPCKCICVSFVINRSYYSIIEMNRNIYATSTLVIQTTTRQSVNEIVRKILVNKNWNFEDLKKCKNHKERYALLDHRDQRTADHWALLMQRKIIAMSKDVLH